MYEINLDYCQITSYYIDENNTLSDEQAEGIIDELNADLLAIGLNI